MFRKLVLTIIIVALAFGTAVSQTKYFGKNKVQYQRFDWQYLQTRHFDIYFADQMYETGKFAATVLESSYVAVSDQLNYKINSRIPVFIYNSPNEFQQTNIIPSILPEGVGGFTEAFKNRIAIPFNGSTEDFRHVLHHELTHAVIYNLVFGNVFSSILSRQRFFNMPLWLTEGYAEYSSRYGWDYFADMVVRDATINNYLAPLEFLGGYLAYKEGQAVINYIVDVYGEEKIGEIFVKGKVYLTINKALKASIGITQEELWDDFSKEMKRRYWPEIAKRKEINEIAKALTDHSKDGSGFNGKPVFSPKGDRLAIFSDRSDYIEIYLISVVDGHVIENLVKAERSGDLEALHSYLSGITFSPDGEKIAFVVKKEGKDALYFLTIDNKDIFLRKRFDFNSILSPTWSPDGKMVAFSALGSGRRDLMIYDMESDQIYKITDDEYDDMDPSWFPDSKTIAFSSDRPHPDSDFLLNNSDYMPSDSMDYWTIYNKFEYGNYNLFKINVETNGIDPVHCGLGLNREPVVSPDGKKICFISNRNGIDNLYITELETPIANEYAITDILTGIGSPSWSPDGKTIAVSAFYKGGFDIFLLKDWEPAGENGVLEPTNYVKGKYKEIDKNDRKFVDDTELEEEGFSETAPPADTDADVGDAESVDTDVDVIVDAESNDSTSVDSELAKADESADLPKSEKDTTASETPVEDTTRIESGDFVFVSDKSAEDKEDPLSGIFKEVPDDSTGAGFRLPSEKITAMFDSVAANNKYPSGEYKVYNYKAKFTPDFVSGGFSYDTFFGLRGQSVIVFSDYLGDHQFVLATDLVNTLDQTNFQVFYFYNRQRYNLGAGIFHTKNYYLDNRNHLFSDRFYGAQGYFSWPFSQFSRAEIVGSQYFIDRNYQDIDDTLENRSSQVTTATFSLVQDNIIWGITGPLNGRRSRLDIEGAVDLFNSREIDMSFISVEADYRKYTHLKGLFSLAYRFSGGASWGSTPKRYFLGGTSNKIGSTTIDAEVYDVENLYFSSIVTPLRGYDYFELSGDRYFLANFEFRYPFVDYLKMNFPLPLTIGYVTGNWFFDIGAAWDKERGFKGATTKDGNRLVDIKSAFGFGIRVNLGIFVLRYDLAWRTDFSTIADHPRYYFSIGADF